MNSYIERVCRELATRPQKQVEAESKFLITVFEQIEGLPSPQKEDLFIDLLLEGDTKAPDQISEVPSHDRTLAA